MVCFGVLKVLWGVERDRIEKEEGGTVNKSNFISVYARVREKTFTPELIKKAFSKTGIQPWDPSVITPEMMAPSKSHSTEVGAPLPLPSPIREIRNTVFSIINPNPTTSFPQLRNIIRVSRWDFHERQNRGIKPMVLSPPFRLPLASVQ